MCCGKNFKYKYNSIYLSKAIIKLSIILNIVILVWITYEIRFEFEVMVHSPLPEISVECPKVTLVGNPLICSVTTGPHLGYDWRGVKTYEIESYKETIIDYIPGTIIVFPLWRMFFSQ